MYNAKNNSASMMIVINVQREHIALTISSLHIITTFWDRRNEMRKILNRGTLNEGCPINNVLAAI
jgi:hypothetical protein